MDKNKFIQHNYSYDKDGLMVEFKSTVNKTLFKHYANIEGVFRDSLIELGWTPPQPSPVLEAGMWVETEFRQLRFITKIKDSYATTLELSGEPNGNGCRFYKPHTFTESDLSLLNTDEVKYELKKVGKEYYVYSQNTNEKGGEKIGSMYDSIHDAIKAEFDERVAMNLLRKQIGE